MSQQAPDPPDYSALDHTAPVTADRPAGLTRVDWLWAFGIFSVASLVRLVIMGMMATANGYTLHSLFYRWDAEYYVSIARDGYFAITEPVVEVPVYERSLAFFPGFPYLLRGLHAVLHPITGLHHETIAYGVNFLLGVVMIAGVMALVNRIPSMNHWGAKTQRARILAAILISGVPMGITFNMAYSESLFGALSIWALVAIMDRRWLLAGLLVFATGLTRIPAVDVMLVLFLAVLTTDRKNWRGWLATLLSPLGLLWYLWWSSSYLTHIGGYFGMQREGWNSAFDWGIATWKFATFTMFASRELGYFLSVAVMIAFVFIVAGSFRKLPWQIWVFSAAVAANILLSDGIMHSRPRLLIPAYLLLLPLVFFFARRLSTPAQITIAVSWLLWGAWFGAYMLGVFPWAI